MIRGTFEIELADGSGVLTGRVEPAVIEDLASFFDRNVVATLRVVSARHSVDGTESESYTLIAIT